MHHLEGLGIHSHKVIRDPLYTFIEVPTAFLPIIDSETFQRLRWIGQIPLEQLVYPSAQHSRFEHSLGVMHLAMIAALSLIKNSRSRLGKACESDPLFSQLKHFAEKKRQFVLAAGLCGLLHDIGHAPFSHTLEHACHYTKTDIRYDHEQVGYLLAQRLLDKTGYLDNPYAQVAIRVLNKRTYTKKDLHPTERILRNLIDGPIDVDKGDYIKRDSYHCGLTYGTYDTDRLWRNIVITPDYRIGSNQKGALESWSLRIARFKMHRNVYKHNTRNVIDGLLLEILADTLDTLTPEHWNHDIIPLKNSTHKIHEDEFRHFNYWTDETILKEIEKQGAAHIRKQIQSFRKRDLYKTAAQIDISHLVREKGVKEVIQKIRNEKQVLEKKLGTHIQFAVIVDAIPPIFEKEIQHELLIQKQSRGDVRSQSPKTQTLAAFLNCEVKELDEIQRPPHILHIFVPQAEVGKRGIVEREMKKIINLHE